MTVFFQMSKTGTARARHALCTVRAPALQLKLRRYESSMTPLLALALFLCTTLSAADWQSYPLRKNGTIPVWTVAGPFPNGTPLVHGPGCFGYYKDYLQTVGGEQHCVPAPWTFSSATRSYR